MLSSVWTGAWASLDSPLRDSLLRIGLVDPIAMAATFDIELDAEGCVMEQPLYAAFSRFLDQIGLGEDGIRPGNGWQICAIHYPDISVFCPGESGLAIPLSDNPIIHYPERSVFRACFSQ